MRAERLLIALCAAASSSIAQVTRVSFQTDATVDATIGVALDGVAEIHRALRSADEATLTLPLPGASAIELELQRVHVFAHDAMIVAIEADGGETHLRPQGDFFRGQVVGDPVSRVFLSFDDEEALGWIHFAGENFVVAAPPDGVGATLIYNTNEFPADLWDASSFACQVIEATTEAGPPVEMDYLQPNCRIATLAIETDHEYRQLFPGNPKTISYTGTLIGAMNEIYGGQFNLRFQIGFLRLWTTPDDPWTSGSTGAQLTQFRNHWNNNMGHVPRSLAHFLSGRALGGGVAYLPGLCNGNFAYGLSANLSGSFPYPLRDNHWNNWDIVVVAHEIGHNSGAPHTHDMNPQIDNCGGGNCSGANNGTIMSYCHTCPPGMTNINLNFHQRMVDERIVPYVNGINPSCGLESVTPSTAVPPQDATYCVGGSLQMSVTPAGGTIFSYQWRHNGQPIDGQTASTLNLATTTPDSVGSYDVIITNECGAATISPSATAHACWNAGDVTGDCHTGFADLLTVISNFGQTGVPRQAGDVTGDGMVGIEDLLIVLSEFSSYECP